MDMVNDSIFEFFSFVLHLRWILSLKFYDDGRVVSYKELISFWTQRVG